MRHDYMDEEEHQQHLKPVAQGHVSAMVGHLKEYHHMPSYMWTWSTLKDGQSVLARIDWLHRMAHSQPPQELADEVNVTIDVSTSPETPGTSLSDPAVSARVVLTVLLDDLSEALSEIEDVKGMLASMTYRLGKLDDLIHSLYDVVNHEITDKSQ